jgi:hypothetical protein
MTIPRAVWIAMASAIAVVPGAVAQSPDPGEASCPVTINNGLGLKRSVGEPPAGNHGNDSRTIATSLWSDGTVTFRPGGAGCIDDEGGMSMKWPWWHEGTHKHLVIEGRRLDGDAPLLRARIPDGYSGEFQVSALIFPTPGCWQVTGRVDDQSLTFVVRAVKMGYGPRRCEPRP